MVFKDRIFSEKYIAILSPSLSSLFKVCKEVPKGEQKYLKRCPKNPILNISFKIHRTLLFLAYFNVQTSLAKMVKQQNFMYFIFGYLLVIFDPKKSREKNPKKYEAALMLWVTLLYIWIFFEISAKKKRLFFMIHRLLNETTVFYLLPRSYQISAVCV